MFIAMIFFTACGGGSKSVNQGDEPDTGKTVTDEDTTDTEPDDSEPSDTEPDDPENPDTTPDNGDTTPDGGDSAPDNGDTTPDSGDTAPDGGDTEPDDDADSDSERPAGIYLGIIGFNYKLNTRDISILTNTSMPEFHAFIDDELPMDDGTALYYADYEALKMMQNYTPVPPNLQTVALVTFTDGEDTSSDGPNDPENYGADYPNVIHNMIVNGSGIHGRQVEAYSIGLRSGDTGSYANFMSRLEKLASEPKEDYAFVVDNMDEVKARFNEIAENLYHVFKTVDIDFKVLGNYPDGTRMRFTFDIYCDHDENSCEKNGINSKLYIEVTYRRSGNERSFEDFSYYGFSGNLTTVQCGERDEKGFYPCKFENIQYNDINTEIKQIELWKQDGSEWKHENESLKKEESEIKDSKSSALIMLVLDCTTSLGVQKFEEMKEAAKDFITTLVNGGSAVTTTPCDPNPCTSITNSNGNCTVSGTNYTCGCNSGYDWTGSQCVKPATPCDPNPCTSIANSTHICTVSGTGYVCGCNDDYEWSGNQCLSTIDPAITCYAEDHKQLNAAGTGCECMANYHADGEICVADPTCNAEDHKELNEAHNACVCVAGYHADGNNCVEDTVYCSAVFNGTDSKIEVAHNELLNLDSETWTIEAWIKQPVKDVADEIPIVGKKNSSSVGIINFTYSLSHYYTKTTENSWGQQTTTTAMKGMVRSAQAGISNSIEATSLTNSGDWTHIALVINNSGSGFYGGKLTLYINGTNVKSNSVMISNFNIATSTQNLLIGSTGSKSFEGLIDSIRISNTARYTEDFTATALSADDNTIAFWDFSGNANDSSGHGLNGTATNITYSTDCE